MTHEDSEDFLRLDGLLAQICRNNGLARVQKVQAMVIGGDGAPNLQRPREDLILKKGMGGQRLILNHFK